MRTNIRRVEKGLNVAPLVTAIEARPELFDQITARQDHPLSAHHDTKAIFLRWCEGQDIESVFNDLDAVQYPAWPELGVCVNPLISELLLAAGSPLTYPGNRVLGRVMVASLRSGGNIDRHIDEGAYADHYERFHIALRSDEMSTLCVERDDGVLENVWMNPGEAWWFNHKRPHECANYGDSERWHLIIDAVAPEYRREREEG